MHSIDDVRVYNPQFSSTLCVCASVCLCLCLFLLTAVDHSERETSYWEQATDVLDVGVPTETRGDDDDADSELVHECVDASEACVDHALAGDCDDSKTVRTACCKSCTIYEEIWMPLLSNF